MITIAGFIALTVAMYFLIIYLLTPKPDEINHGEFLDKYRQQSEIADSAITKLVIKDNHAIMYQGDIPKYKTYFEDRTAFVERIIKAGEQVEEDKGSAATIVPYWIEPLGNGNLMPSIISIASTLLLFVLMFMIFRQVMGAGKSGTMGFGKSRARANENVKVRFSDVAGAEEEKEELKEIVEF